MTTIWGPWNEPYLRDLQGTPFVFDSNHDPIAALANKRTCLDNIKKKPSVFRPVSADKNFNMLTVHILLFPAEPTCETKIRKIREQRDDELEDARFDQEEEMANIRLERDTEVANITAQERADLESIRTEKTQELQRVLAQQVGNR